MVIYHKSTRADFSSDIDFRYITHASRIITSSQVILRRRGNRNSCIITPILHKHAFVVLCLSYHYGIRTCELFINRALIYLLTG